MSNISAYSISSEVEEQLIQNKQYRWKDFTPERVAYISQEIEKHYVPSVGIRIKDLCSILYGYNPARRSYEGICFHFFNLVATKNGKGNVFFIKKSEVGSSAFPVIPSIWHNLDTVVEEDGSSELSDVVNSLENSWNNSSSSELDVNLLHKVCSTLLETCSKLLKLIS